MSLIIEAQANFDKMKKDRQLYQIQYRLERIANLTKQIEVLNKEIEKIDVDGPLEDIYPSSSYCGTSTVTSNLILN